MTQAGSVTIHSRLKIIGVNPFVLVSAEKAAQLKNGRRLPIPVTFRINTSETSWHVNLMPVGDGSFRLFLNGEIRKVSKLKVGETLSLEVRYDEKYKNGPLHPMPSWFSKPLSQNLLAQRGWELLSPSRKKEILRYFVRLKSPEAKERNLSRALDVLAGRQGRFMGRVWNENIEQID